ncbi:8-amino-7-oxononanoate synthase [Limimaricola pyoseonensis]|uniref:8-amino-7-oxononanoate synthase n=1 Tax=Limimaricola pyoseonensis TaxID=521013 RepID=A0A1G6ZP43_9RHOB|nr:8-amino-7-oxononanoate synthase [Limimaricola pyoseonensis]SDE04319.1 8-amino-7-oxononanoate synthase [Limimaricola pyoseonensis]
MSAAAGQGRPGFPRHAEALDALGARGRRRALMPRAGRDFSSNDYLGLAASDLLRDAAREALNRGVAVGSGGSRLLRGNAAEHEALEREAAAFFGAEAALYMGGGFPGNVALFAALPMQGDLVLHDALVHASAHDGMKMGRAECRAFAHNDAGAARDALRAWRAEGGRGRAWIACESLYSMEGDLAPLDALADVAAEDGAVLVVDEAHATGLYGERGQGLAHGLDASVDLVTLHTCGKALGAVGGLVCGDEVLVDTLVNRARNFVFSTAPSPLDAAIVRAALTIVASRPDLREAAWTNIRRAHAAASRFGAFDTQILPILIGEDPEAVALAQALQARGHDVRAIRPPTVPRGTARLRVSITPNVTGEEIDALFADLQDLRRAAA